MKRRRPARGLTLIEIAIALAVIAILGALALPSYGARLQQQRLRGAAEMLAADIGEARFEAARRGSAMHVLARPGEGWCWAVATEAGCDCADAGAPACRVHRVQASQHPGVRLLTAEPVPLAANGSSAAATAATFESPRGDRLRVEVSALGRPRVCAAAGSWAKVPPC